MSSLQASRMYNTAMNYHENHSGSTHSFTYNVRHLKKNPSIYISNETNISRKLYLASRVASPFKYKQFDVLYLHEGLFLKLPGIVVIGQLLQPYEAHNFSSENNYTKMMDS